MCPASRDDMSRCETERLRACVEIGKLLTSTLELEEILRLILEKGNRVIAAENWSLLLRDRKTGELTFEVVVGVKRRLLKNIRLERGMGIAGYVAESGEPLYISDVRSDSRFNQEIDAQTGFVTRSIVCVPLKIHGHTLGVVEVVNARDMRIFEEEDLPFLQILADYAAIAIENAQYVAQIQRMAITDEYTGLYNARYLHRILDQLLTEARSDGTPLAVAFVDVDNFKDVVDVHGHLQGSRTLKELGRTMREHLAKSDILVKYGGDEFVIILPRCHKKAALSRLEPILRAIEDTPYLTSLRDPVRVTASFGVAVFPDDAETKKDLLIAADNSMYRVKRSTKNGIGIVAP